MRAPTTDRQPDRSTVQRFLCVTRLIWSLPAAGILSLSFAGCGVESGSAVPTADMEPADMMQTARESQPPSSVAPEFNTESYDQIVENRFVSAAESPLSTFSIDVDTASYANVRRFLNDGTLPPAGAVRIEELINYFRYDYPQPDSGHPFSVNIEAAACPWQSEHVLAKIGLKGVELDAERRPPANLVFLLDVSGSMGTANKLPLVKRAMRLLLQQLDEQDRIAIVVYAGASGLVLPATPASDRGSIVEAIERLDAGGSTNGGEGIQLAYNVATQNFTPGGVNRVVLCTDGDFNVGTTDRSALLELIEREAKRDVFLTVLGFGSGNLKDSTMEQLADHGNGNYGYIDSLQEARKLLVEDALGTLITIARDVKIQVDFNPQHVQAYRLIGYENRLLRSEDFRDDQKDAGEIGSGHTVTALYEIVPAGIASPVLDVEPSKYQQTTVEPTGPQDELLTVRLRYKRLDSDDGIEFHVPSSVPITSGNAGSDDFRFAASVAAFGMLLRDSEYAGSASFEAVESLARSAVQDTSHESRHEFLRLINIARQLKEQSIAAR